MNVFGRVFPGGVGFLSMELPTFQCNMCCKVTFLKTVFFQDLFDILKLEYIEVLYFVAKICEHLITRK